MTVAAIAAAEAPLSVPRVPLPLEGAGRVRFLGSDRAYWRLLVRGAILLMLTLGIYRFWLSTDMRRFLWANTEIGDDTLEYSGTARELLIGFLIALATLTPLYTAFFFFGLGMFGQWSAVIAFAVLTWFGHFAVYRARRYRLTRTVFRGLRFHQTGAAWRYACSAVLWWTVIILTLGLAYPWAQASLERYKMIHTFYGDLRAHFAGSGARLFGQGFFMWLLVVGPLIGGLVVGIRSIDWIALSQTVLAGGDNMMARIETASPDFAKAIVFVIAACVWSILAAALLYPAFQAMTLRWWASSLRFGEITAISRLRTGKVYGVYLRFLVFALLFAVIAGIIAGVVFALFTAVFGAAEASEAAELVAVIGGVAGYVVIMLGYSTIYQATVRLRLWKVGFESTELLHAEALDRVRAAGDASSPFGEGLADALNVGGL